MGNLVLREESWSIRGAVFRVYREMGCGFLQPVYRECLCLELDHRGIPWRADVELPLVYRDKRLRQVAVADLVCYGQVLVEVRALGTLGNEQRARTHNLLHAGGFRLGLLVNFGHHPGVEIERIVI